MIDPGEPVTPPTPAELEARGIIFGGKPATATHRAQLYARQDAARAIQEALDARPDAAANPVKVVAIRTAPQNRAERRRAAAQARHQKTRAK